MTETTIDTVRSVLEKIRDRWVFGPASDVQSAGEQTCDDATYALELIAATPYDVVAQRSLIYDPERISR